MLDTLQSQTENKIEKVYGDDVPAEIIKRKNELMKNLELHGMAPPPLYLCIGKKENHIV